MNRGFVAVAVAVLVVIPLAGCTGSNAQPRDTGPVTSVRNTGTPQPSTSQSVDPAAQPAVDAYLKYMAAAANAERKPWPISGKPSAEADFTKYSFDPIRVLFAQYIVSLAGEGVSFRGTPPEPRIVRVSPDLAAKPYPVVVIVNCPTEAPSWKAYVDKTGAEVPAANPTAAPPPYLVTAQVIYYENHWGVWKVSPDTSKTCRV